METIVLAFIMMAIGLMGAVVGYKFKESEQKALPTIEELERQRQERIERAYQELFNYNESIATRGYKQ